MKDFQYNTKARRLKRYLGIALRRPLTGPAHVSLEVTHHCNLRCSFCESHGVLQEAPITARREYAGGKPTMDMETVRRLAGQLAGVKTDLVELSGKGDPIAHPRLAEIIMDLKDAGLTCALVTNGTLAQPHLASTLVEKGLDRLSVSLNAGCREVYLRSNGKDLWDDAVRFIESVLEERRRSGGNRPWVRISHVVTKENIDDMDGMARICADLGVDQADYYVMGELPETLHLQLDESDIKVIRAGLNKWVGMLERARVYHELPLFLESLEIRLKSGGETRSNALQRRIPCYIGWNFCVIGPDGTVVPCCYCEDTRLGNVNENSFVDIWHGVLYEKFRRDALEMPRTGKWICEECFTTCNRAMENRNIYNKIHPLRRIPMEVDPKRCE